MDAFTWDEGPVAKAFASLFLISLLSPLPLSTEMVELDGDPMVAEAGRGDDTDGVGRGPVGFLSALSGTPADIS